MPTVIWHLRLKSGGEHCQAVAATPLLVHVHNLPIAVASAGGKRVGLEID